MFNIDKPTSIEVLKNSLGAPMWDAYEELLKFLLRFNYETGYETRDVKEALFDYNPYRYFECCGSVQVEALCGSSMKLAIDPKAKFLISCAWKTIEKWNIEAQQKIWKIETEWSSNQISINFDGDILGYSYSCGHLNYTVFISTETGEKVDEMVHEFSNAYFDKYQPVIYMMKPTSHLDNLFLRSQKYEIVHFPGGKIYDISYNSRLVAQFGSRAVYIWDAKSQRQYSSFGGHKKEVDDAAISLDKVVSISEESYKSNVVISDLRQCKTLHVIGRDFRIPRCVAFSPYGQVFALGCFQALAIWDADLGEEICVLDDKGVEAIVFSPDGRMLFSGYDTGEIVFWGIKSI